MDQSSAPLWEALCGHARQVRASLHIPGHRGGSGLPAELVSLTASQVFGLDLTELPGLDDLHTPRGVIAAAQELTARAFGADASFFLVNGTTCGLQALVMAAAAAGKKLLIPRNAHRSVLGGLVMAGADPAYFVPEIVEPFGIDAGFSLEGIERALAENPATGAVLVVRPNYYGVAAGLKSVAGFLKGKGLPVLVDEAHGAHLHFHPQLPDSAMAAGAAACVQSMHKVGGSLGQSSLLHLRGGSIDEREVARALRLLQTTSPSYLLMASLDLARRQLALGGEKILDRVLATAAKLRSALAGVRGLEVLEDEHLPPGAELDPTRVTVSVRKLGLTGYQVKSLLAGRYRVFVEMADWQNIVAVVSLGTKEEDVAALVSALEDIAAREKRDPKDWPAAARLLPPPFVKRMPPRQAWFMPWEEVELDAARGRISAETVAVYPPGIPAVCPGEEITPPVHEYLKEIAGRGLHCQGPSDPALKKIRVVVE